MHILPSIDLSYRPLHELAMGPLKAAFLNCGIRFKVFDVLMEFAAAEEVALLLGTHPGNTRRLLDALATLDLLEKRRDASATSPWLDIFW